MNWNVSCVSGIVNLYNLMRVHATPLHPLTRSVALFRLGLEISFVNEKAGKLDAIENNLEHLKCYLDRHRDWNYFNILCTRRAAPVNDRQFAVQ